MGSRYVYVGEIDECEVVAHIMNDWVDRGSSFDQELRKATARGVNKHFEDQLVECCTGLMS